MGSTGGCERMIPLQFALRRRMMMAGKDLVAFENGIWQGYEDLTYVSGYGAIANVDGKMRFYNERGSGGSNMYCYGASTNTLDLTPYKTAKITLQPTTSAQSAVNSNVVGFGVDRSKKYSDKGYDAYAHIQLNAQKQILECDISGLRGEYYFKAEFYGYRGQILGYLIKLELLA